MGCCTDKPFFGLLPGSRAVIDVDEYVIVFQRLVVHVICANAEIERAAEIRCETEFLTQLPSVLIGKIFYDKPVRTTQLRITKYASWNDIEKYPLTAPNRL